MQISDEMVEAALSAAKFPDVPTARIVFRAALEAVAPMIRAAALEEAARVLDDVTAGHRRVSDMDSRNGYARGMELALYAAKTSENASAAIRALKEPT